MTARACAWGGLNLTFLLNLPYRQASPSVLRPGTHLPGPAAAAQLSASRGEVSLALLGLCGLAVSREKGARRRPGRRINPTRKRKTLPSETDPTAERTQVLMSDKGSGAVRCCFFTLYDVIHPATPRPAAPP